jgi:hypothetical protein
MNNTVFLSYVPDDPAPSSPELMYCCDEYVEVDPISSAREKSVHQVSLELNFSSAHEVFGSHKMVFLLTLEPFWKKVMACAGK